MKVKTVFVHMTFSAGIEAHATIDVPGLGEVKIIHALPTELCYQIFAASEASLRLKLGQTIKEDPTNPGTGAQQ